MSGTQREVIAPRDTERPNLFLEEVASKVRPLNKNEIAEVLNNLPQPLREKIQYLFLPGSSFEVNGRAYGVTYTQRVEPPSQTVLKAFIYQVDAAAEKAPIIENYTPYYYNRKALPLLIDDGRVFQFYDSYRIRVGIEDIEDLARSSPSNYKEISSYIQGSVLHELLHMLRVDLYMNDMLPKGPAREHVSQLGEFLYNPKDNKVANAKFRRYVEGFGKGEKIGYHGEDWITMTKILLWEYKQLRDFSIPESREAQLELISHLDSLYADVPAKQRDQILKKYLMLSDGEIERLSSLHAKELNLKF